jgi:hypothetical protein
MDRLRNYVLVRCKKRWQVLPASAIVGAFAIASSLRAHDGKVMSIIVFLIGFNLLGILFPFRWGGEDWDNREDHNQGS